MTLTTTIMDPRTISADRLLPEVLAHEPRLVAWRRHLHTIPELGFAEQKTGAFLAQCLTAEGIAVRQGVAGTGLVAVVEGAAPGPTIAFRADIDGLPLQEEPPLPGQPLSYASTHPGAMHACGHDGHMAVLLSLLTLLQHRRTELRGRVVGFFQPAEEHPGGARPMIEAGVLRDYQPSTIYGLHLWNFLDTGSIACHPGPLMAGSDVVEIRLRGKGGHGAYPHRADDLVLVAAHLITALHSIVGRDLNPLDAGVITIGQVMAGTAHNIFPEDVTLRGSVRSLSPQVQDTLERRIREVSAGIAAAFQVAADVHYERLYPVTVNAPGPSALAQEAVTAVLGEQGLVHDGRTLAAEDMGFWLQQVPGCYLLVGSRNAKKHLTEPHHSPRFNIDEEALTIGLDVLYRIALATVGPSPTA